MVHRNINDIEIPFFIWKKLVKKEKARPNLAFDTETINGKVFLIYNSNGDYTNDREFKNLSGLLQWMNNKNYRSTVNFFYNLEYDTNAILKFLDRKDRIHIAEFNYVDYEDFRISVIPRKELKISKVKNDKLLHSTVFYDLAQFYDFKKLAFLAETTPYNKVYVNDISAINREKYYSDKDYNALLNERCYIDCKITIEKANKLTNAVHKLTILNKWRSNASISRNYVLSNLSKNLKLPTPKLLDVALKTYHAGHIETNQIGLFKNVHNYDIKCFDVETELLTKEGFKKWDEFTEKDKVGTLNLNNGHIEYQNILHVHKYKYKGNLISIKNTNMDIMATPNHRMYYQVHNRCKNAKNIDEYNTWSNYKVDTLENIPNGNIRIPTLGIYNDGVKPDIDMNWIKLCAWTITEGHFKKENAGIVIYQSDKYNYQSEIRDILNNLNIDYKETSRGLRKGKNYNSYEFYIRKPDNINLQNLLNNKKEIPEEWVNNWDKKTLKVFFWELMKGDGSFRCQKGKMDFKSYNDHDLDMMQQICFKIGFRSSINYKNHTIHINRNRDGTFSNIQAYQKKVLVPYDNWVWCVTTPNDTVIVRRNGKIFITGNSAYPSFIANLYETSGGYLHNTEYEPDTAYSYYDIEIDYANEYVSPLWFNIHGKNYHPNGKFNTKVTKTELEYLMLEGYSFKILSGHHLTKDKYTTQPFYDIIHDLYNERLKCKDDETKQDIEKVIKIILNAIYGVTLNTIHKKIIADSFYETDLWSVIDGKMVFYTNEFKATNMYNPVYGCDITAQTRSKLFTDFRKKFDKIISINTDGVYMSDTTNKIKISKNLGDYGYKNLDQVMVMGSGRYFTFANNGIDNNESKFRGVSKAPKDIHDEMINNKNKQCLHTIKDKPIKLKESLKNSNYYNFTIAKFPIQDFNLVDEFNVFNRVEKDIYYKTDKRFWFDKINTIGDLWDKQIQSRPFNISELK